MQVCDMASMRAASGGREWLARTASSAALFHSPRTVGTANGRSVNNARSAANASAVCEERNRAFISYPGSVGLGFSDTFQETLTGCGIINIFRQMTLQFLQIRR